jgi:hypothetical protein
MSRCKTGRSPAANHSESASCPISNRIPSQGIPDYRAKSVSVIVQTGFFLRSL